MTPRPNSSIITTVNVTNSKVKVSDSIRYIGVYLAKNLKFKKHTKETSEDISSKKPALSWFLD